MIRLFWVLAVITVNIFANAGCGRRSPIQGDWSTVDEFGDSSGMATATITLVHEGDVVSGNFTFTSLPDEAKEELGKTTFPLEQVRFNGSQITFVVPILPDDSHESLLFKLQLEGEALSGTMKENDPENDKSILVQFRKT